VPNFVSPFINCYPYFGDLQIIAGYSSSWVSLEKGVLIAITLITVTGINENN